MVPPHTRFWSKSKNKSHNVLLSNNNMTWNDPTIRQIRMRSQKKKKEASTICELSFFKSDPKHRCQIRAHVLGVANNVSTIGEFAAGARCGRAVGNIKVTSHAGSRESVMCARVVRARVGAFKSAGVMAGRRRAAALARHVCIHVRRVTSPGQKSIHRWGGRHRQRQRHVLDHRSRVGG